MNLYVRQSPPATTQAAEGMPRRAWTVAEVEEMVKAGIIAENERIELIGGEIVPMSPKGAFHETAKKELTRFWVPLLTPDIDLATETTFRYGERDFLEPDFVFWPRAFGIRDLNPASCSCWSKFPTRASAMTSDARLRSMRVSGFATIGSSTHAL